ncbi:MAG: IMP dehydrogenase [Fervidicoccaceae archaeon]
MARASVAMSGRLFAPCNEASSQLIGVGDKLYINLYRGMGSATSMRRRFSADRYSRPSKTIEEGVEGLVEYWGSLAEILAELMGEMKTGLGYAGAKSIEDSWRCESAKISPVGSRELRPPRHEDPAAWLGFARD